VEHSGASFVGRQRDLVALGGMVDEGAPLVTVLGPAGIGKTRLAAELVEARRESFDAVWFCDVSEARGPLDTCGAIARDVGAGLDGSASLDESAEQLATVLAEAGRALLVLDNFEQIVESAAAIVERLQSKQLTILVTSRERLRIRGERVLDLDALSEDDATALFVARARDVRHGYDPGDAADDVRAICKDLDGLPLAIELAAARMRVLSASELRTRLATRFELLTSAPRGTSTRHATLRGAIDWSWDLLSDAERSALMQCSVFEGGFTVDAAEAVLQPDDTLAVLNALQALRDKSLLRAHQGERMRFSLYMSIRDYAREKLKAEGLARDVRLRHADHYLAKGLAAAALAEGHRAAEARRYLRDETDNLLAIHRRSLHEPNDAERALRAAIVLQPVLITGGPAALRLRLLDDAIAIAPPDATGTVSQLKGWARVARADCLLGLGRLDEARQEFDRAAAKAEEHGDKWLDGRCQWRLGTLLWISGDAEEAVAHVERAVALAREIGDDIHVGRSLGSLGVLHAERGLLAEARNCYGRALKLHEAQGDRRWIATTTGRLGHVDDAERKLDDAEARYREAIEGHRAGGNHRHEAQILASLGAVELERGRPEPARACFDGALALHKRVSDQRAEAACRVELADCLTVLGEHDEAAANANRSRDIAHGLGNARLEACAISLLARNRLAARDIDAAVKLLDEAAALADDEVAGAVTIVTWGHIDMARDDREGARERLTQVKLVAQRHAIVRRAAQHLERALDDEPPDDVLVVCSSGEWFKAAGHEKVDLRTRRSLRLVLRALIRQRFNQAGDALSTEALFEAGWPGERAQPHAATSRVYVALSTLRKLGLRDTLVKREGGYLLDEAAAIKRWS
jgi:predicted ATPase